MTHLVQNVHKQQHLKIGNFCMYCTEWGFLSFSVRIRIRFKTLSRAGRAKILSRHRGHVFRPQSCLLLKYYYIWCGYTPSRHRDLNTFWIFSGPWGSILRCREAIKLSCAQLCKTGCFRESKSSSDFVTFWLSVYTCYIFLSIFALIKESFGESDSDFKSVSLHIYLKICI